MMRWPAVGRADEHPGRCTTSASETQFAAGEVTGKVAKKITSRKIAATTRPSICGKDAGLPAFMTP
jgi:hypothetical protein